MTTPSPAKRTREECDAELLDFLVEKTFEWFMPGRKPPPPRNPLLHGKRKKPTAPS